MAEDVSSWFIDQLNLRSSEPKLAFYIGTSDHSPSVDKWPKIKTDAEKISPTNITVTLANEDGIYNDFYSQLYTMNTSCYFQFGFTHPESGDELYTVYRGNVRKVDFDSQTKVKLHIYNKFYDISRRKIGETDAPASFGAQIPSDIVWTICTCYGNLSSVESTSNPDLNFEKFETWANTFSADNVTGAAHFTGETVAEGLQTMARQTDSFIFDAGDGRITFERFSENSSLDFTLAEGEYSQLKVTVDGLSVINQQHVDFNYSVASDYWQSRTTAVSSTSVNSYGTLEDVRQSENFWFVDSVDALSLANRRLTRWSTPPRKFNLTAPLIGFHRTAADTIRFVNSYFGVNSSQGWRISARSINMNPKRLEMTFETNEGYVANAFYLDVHNLDGDEFLL